MSYKNGLWIFDNTELDFYRKCPRYYLYRAMKGYSGAEDAIPLVFGIAVHQIIEDTFKGVDWGTAVERGVEYFAPYDNGVDQKRSVGTLRHIMTHYFLHYTPETFHPLEGMVEVGFAINLDRDVVYTGRLDAVGEYDGYPGIWTFDHKTAWRIDDYQLKPHNQFSGYIVAGMEYFEGLQGLLANLILVSKDSCQLKKRQLDDDISPYYKGKAPEDCFFRSATQRTPIEVEDWKKSTLYWVRQIQSSIEKDEWPQNTTYGCNAYNKQCEFYPVCIQPDLDQAEELLRSPLFKYNPWEPYSEESKSKEVTDQTRTLEQPNVMI